MGKPGGWASRLTGKPGECMGKLGEWASGLINKPCLNASGRSGWASIGQAVQVCPLLLNTVAALYRVLVAERGRSGRILIFTGGVAVREDGACSLCMCRWMPMGWWVGAYGWCLCIWMYVCAPPRGVCVRMRASSACALVRACVVCAYVRAIVDVCQSVQRVYKCHV